MIDQRRLPDEEVYLRCRDHHEVAAAIKDMAIRGAPAIGVAAAFGIALGVRHSTAEGAALRAEFEDICAELAATRPTAVNLFWAIERMRRRFDARRRAEAATPFATALLAEAAGHPRRGPRGLPPHGRPRRRAPAGRGADPHPLQRGGPGHRRLRHGAGRDPLGRARRARCSACFADETRPYLQGARLTAWELHAGRHPHHPDRRQHGRPPDGARARWTRWWWAPTASPPTATSPTRSAPTRVAVLAKENGIPFYVAAPVSTFDLATPTGAEIPIEERPADEVTHHGGPARWRPEGVAVRNPAFDVTPAPLRDRDRLRARRGPRRPTPRACARSAG